MTWFLAAILAYFLLAIVSLFDRYILIGPVHEPKIYAFGVGALTFFVAFLIIPFGINLPSYNFILIGLASGFVRIFGIMFLYEGIHRLEVSRVVPAMNGFMPIFSFLIFFLFFPGAEVFGFLTAVAFILLIGGSVLISPKKLSHIFSDFKNLKYPLISAFLLSVNFFLTKNLFVKTDFLSGLFLMMLGVGIGTAALFVFPDFRNHFKTPRISFKISGLIILTQIFGAAGGFLQFYAIYLSKPLQVPLINALEGTRDLFLLFFVFMLSLWRPNLLKEKIDGANGFQKILAVILIAAGLAVLALK